jgi:hypothetical protein
MISLLGDPLTDAILQSCRGQHRTLRDLREATGGSSTVLKERLGLLTAYGLVAEGPVVQGEGRPASSWLAYAVDELETFVEQADAFALALVKATERMLEEADAPPRTRLRAVDAGE